MSARARKARALALRTSVLTRPARVATERAGEPQLAQRQVFALSDDGPHFLRRDRGDHRSALVIALADDELFGAQPVSQRGGVRGDDELAAFACFPQTFHDEPERLGMQSVVDLLDAGERGRIRVVQHGQQAQEAHRAVRRVHKGGRPAQASFFEENGHAVGASARVCAVDGLQLRQDVARVLHQALPHLVVDRQFEEEGGQVVGVSDKVSSAERTRDGRRAAVTSTSNTRNEDN